MNDLNSAGYASAALALTAAQCDHIASSLPVAAAGVRRAVRGLVTHPTVLQLLHHKQLGAYLWSIVGRDLIATKATLLDGGTEQGGPGEWHQDRVIAVRERMDVVGYSSWSSRAGLLEVEAPSSVLQQMLLVCVYLDDSGPENGPLRVIPGSHEYGKLAAADIQNHVATGTPVEVHARCGTLLLMRPLLIRSSSVPRISGQRRVLQIELAPAEAISPLQWHTAVPLRRAA